MSMFKSRLTSLAFTLVGAGSLAGGGCAYDVVEEEAVGFTALPLLMTLSFQDGVNGYVGTADTYIDEEKSGNNYGSNGTCQADGFQAWWGSDKSCLIRWSLNGVAPSVAVTSASITLHVVDGSAENYSFYALKRGWEESRATWNRATASSSWGSSGADAASDRGELIGTATGGDGASRSFTLNAQGIALVQGWLDGTRPNYGIIVANSGALNGVDFASREHSVAHYRPKLTISYKTVRTTPDPELLVAFIGDQGLGSTATSVLQLIKSEGAHAALHNGDYDYADNPAAWNSQVDAVLGPNFPYFAVVGNHDAPRWNGVDGYQSHVYARQARVPEMNCEGDLGVKASCNFRGLQIVQSCIGTFELGGHGDCGPRSSEQVSFIRDALARDNALWKVCSWHKNQHDMQVGDKFDEVGWDAYRECVAGGAIIATGHEHSYSRTYTLTDMGNYDRGYGRVGSPDVLDVGLGRSFVFVSGLGGRDIRDFSSFWHADATWWASYYTSNRWLKNGVSQPLGAGAAHGALFLRFNVDGDPRKAYGYFKDVNGRMVDQFTVRLP